jgi:hypothetical protein
VAILAAILGARSPTTAGKIGEPDAGTDRRAAATASVAGGRRLSRPLVAHLVRRRVAANMRRLTAQIETAR